MDAPSTNPHPDDERSLVGTFVGPFRIEALLGRGGMGAVYKAFDTQLDRWVALKRVSLPPTERRAEFLARFEREARLLSSVSHPNVAQVHYSGTHQGTPYYVMEYVEGRSLGEILAAAGRISGSHCLDYLLQAAKGLEAAYAQGVVHRDVKPSNLMLDATGRIKVVDFGLARRLADDSSLTESDRVLGTPRYMSPEQALALEVDQRSDIYGLGATFYHLFAGVPPFESDSPLALLLQHLEAPLPPLRERNPVVPEAVAAIVERMLAKEPENRYQEYRELIADLEAVLAGGSLTRPTGTAGAARAADGRRGEGAQPATVAAWAPVARAPQPVSRSRPWAPSVAGVAAHWLAPIAVAGTAILLFLFLAESPRPTSPPPAESTEPASKPPAAVATPGPSAPPNALRGLLARPVAAAAVRQAREATTRSSLHRLAVTIEAYTADRGEPPPDLETLREAFALHPRDLFDAWGSEILYEPAGEGGYRLVSAGPDRREGNADDLVLEDGRFVDGPV